MTNYRHGKWALSELDRNEEYKATPVEPASVSFSKQYTVTQSLAIATQTSRWSTGALRIAHNSLYAEANRLDDDQAMNAAYQAREILWEAILLRDRR